MASQRWQPEFPRLRRYLPNSRLISINTRSSYHFNYKNLCFQQTSRTRAPTGSSPGLYSAQQFELTDKNVASVEDGVISVKLLEACGSYPSSTTTMKMGIERVLNEKFGDAIKDIRQVHDEEVRETAVEAVNGHLDILRPAIKNYGGSVEVLSVESRDCVVKYVATKSNASGIRVAIKEKFPDIVKVVFTG